MLSGEIASYEDWASADVRKVRGSLFLASMLHQRFQPVERQAFLLPRSVRDSRLIFPFFPTPSPLPPPYPSKTTKSFKNSFRWASQLSGILLRSLSSVREAGVQFVQMSLTIAGTAIFCCWDGSWCQNGKSSQHFSFVTSVVTGPMSDGMDEMSSGFSGFVLLPMDYKKYPGVKYDLPFHNKHFPLMIRIILKNRHILTNLSTIIYHC